jgi:hypothetical protein
MSVYAGPEATSAAKPAERDFGTAGLLGGALAVLGESGVGVGPLLYDLIAARPLAGNQWPAAVRRPESMTSSSGSAKPSLAAWSIRADRSGRPFWQLAVGR